MATSLFFVSPLSLIHHRLAIAVKLLCRLYELTGSSAYHSRLSHMPVLANELIDTVIDFLHEDRPSLRACGLASKSCLPSARYHLFSDIVVNAFNFPSFLSLIESTSHIGPLVRGLTVCGRDSMGKSPGDVFFAQNIPRVVLSLHNVIRLKIASLLHWDKNVLETFEHSLVHAFGTNLRCLELHRHKFLSFSHTTKFICHFSNLRHLELDWITWKLDNDPCTVHRLQTLEPPTVHTGEIPGGKTTLLLAWLHIQHPPPNLISATICVTDFYSRYVIPPTVGKTLQILHVRSFQHVSEAPSGDLNPLSLAHCTNLTSIRFDCIPLWNRSAAYRHRKWVLDTLAQVKSCVVTELVFTLEVLEEYELDDFDWLGITDVLRHSQFGQLRRVAVILNYDDISPSVSRLVREDRFGVLNDRGILFIEKLPRRRSDVVGIPER